MVIEGGYSSSRTKSPITKYGLIKGQLNMMYGSMGTGKSQFIPDDIDTIKSIEWYGEIFLKGWQRWLGFVIVKGYKRTEYAEMYDWLDETYNPKLYSFMVYRRVNGQLGWYPAESREDIGFDYAPLRIDFKNREDAAAFILTFAGDA